MSASVAGEADMPERLPPVVVEAKRVGPEKKPDPLPDPATSATPPNEQGNGITLTHKDVKYAAAETVKDTLNAVPGVVSPSFGIRHFPFASIRGHVNINFGDPNVPLVLDGVPWADFRALNATLLDVDTIRVERGTQRSAGGREAIAGVVIVESNAPTEEFTAEARTEIGNYGHQIYEAIVSGPLWKDEVLFRVAAQKSLRDGYLYNRFTGGHPDDRNTLALRGEVEFKPLKQLDIRLQGYGTLSHDGAPTLNQQGRGGDIFSVDINSPGHVDVDRFKGALKLRYETPLFTVFSNTARQYFSVDNDTADYDFSPNPGTVLGNERTSVQWSQELRFESREDASIRWRGGAYFEDFTTFDNAFLYLLDTTFIQAPPPAGAGLPFTAPVQDRRQANSHELTGAVFGDATFKLGGGFSLEPGLRIEYRHNTFNRQTSLNALNEHVSIPTGPDYHNERDSTVALPSLKLVYDSEKQWNAYLLGSNGYRPGGFSYLAAEPAITPFKNEYMWTGETGMNGTWLGGKLESSAALFYSYMDNYQVRRESSLTNIRIDNAKRTHMRGAEVELTGRPLKGLELTGRLSLVDAAYESFKDRVTGTRLDNQRVPYAAPYQYYIRARYEHDTGFFSQIDYSGRGRERMRDERPVYQNAHAELGARIGYEHKNFTVFIYGNNLTDTRYAALLFALSSDGHYTEAPGDPRTYGISLTIRY